MNTYWIIAAPRPLAISVELATRWAERFHIFNGTFAEAANELQKRLAGSGVAGADDARGEEDAGCAIAGNQSAVSGHEVGGVGDGGGVAAESRTAPVEPDAGSDQGKTPTCGLTLFDTEAA